METIRIIIVSIFVLAALALTIAFYYVALILAAFFAAVAIGVFVVKAREANLTQKEQA